jgi:hypothetical protein
MKMKKLFLFSVLLASILLSIPNERVLSIAPTDDEKDTTEACPVNPQLTRVICTQGDKDCTPKNC